MLRTIAVLLLFAAGTISAQTYDLPPGALADGSAMATSVPTLAKQVLKTYRDSDRTKDLDARFRLQIAAGDYVGAAKSIASLRGLIRRKAPPQTAANHVQYAIYAQAMQKTASPEAFDAAYAEAFRKTFGELDDKTSALVARALEVETKYLGQDLDSVAQRLRDQPKLELADALKLVKAYQTDLVYRRIAAPSVALVAEDDARRYVIERDVKIRSGDGTVVCALVVRPREAKKPVPALLNFTIYSDPLTSFTEARRSASNGYAGVEGFTRGKACSPAVAAPYEKDGEDAAAVIDWIAAQPWSDGRVGMFGGSYEGFTQWAAAKRMPKALKALMPSVTVAPGIDVPMEGGASFSFVYYWPFYVTNNRELDNVPYEDHARWGRMQNAWYTSGRAYRDLPLIDGTPNPIFLRWLDHPDYDAYWQAMIPFRDEFARIDIPVLTTTGYYDGGQIGALHYVNEHYRYRADAQHYLVVGPYDHVRGQRGTVGRLGDPFTELRGYRLDPVAQLDIGALRYQWFDYVFKRGAKPAVLKDRINFQVMGANTWRHARSIAAMSDKRLALYLDGERLSKQAPDAAKATTLHVDLADRSDVDHEPAGGGIVDDKIETANALVFTSEPFDRPIEVSGLFSGHLEFTTNKRDFDLRISLYEKSANGNWFELNNYLTRASYAADRTRRQLLTPGTRSTLDFTNGRLTSRRFLPGSRLVAVVEINKNPAMQVNHGSGKPVSDETKADAGEPLRIDWLGGSRLEIPLHEGR